METNCSLERDLNNMREYYGSGNTKETSWRESQLKGLRRFLIEKEEDMLKALMHDLGKHHVEAFRDEIGALMKSLNLALKCFKVWMSGNKAKLPKLVLLTSAEVVPEPLGLILIISSWNYPFGLSLEPLIGAVTAGNVVVLKPSELTPSCSALLASTLATYLDSEAIKVIEGGPEESELLLQQRWDKIFFTGSARVGRIVMSSAVKHLTPVTLELGGKNPAVVDSLSSSWDLEVAVKRIVLGKFGSCAGQTCIAIDYVLVENRFCSTLVKLIKVWIKKMFGENPKQSNTIARIINKQHFLRLKNLLTDKKVKESVVYGGSIDEENLFIEPTILVDPPLDAAIMSEEIFGPLLPIITVEKIEDSIKFINSRPKPLALYAFTKIESLQKRMRSETSSGSLTFNDAILQYAVDSLPFGGVGESGFGNYHGKFSFNTFSHQKGILKRSFLSDFWYRYPPWTLNKFQLLEVSYNYDYLGLLLVLIGLKRPSTCRSYLVTQISGVLFCFLLALGHHHHHHPSTATTVPLPGTIRSEPTIKLAVSDQTFGVLHFSPPLSSDMGPLASPNQICNHRPFHHHPRSSATIRDHRPRPWATASPLGLGSVRTPSHSYGLPSALLCPCGGVS